MLTSVQWKFFLESKSFIPKKRHEKPKKGFEEMETTTDEAVDRATSHLPVVKPKLLSIEFESTTQRNPVKSEFISQLQYPASMTQGPSMTFPSGPWQQ